MTKWFIMFPFCHFSTLSSYSSNFFSPCYFPTLSPIVISAFSSLVISAKAGISFKKTNSCFIGIPYYWIPNQVGDDPSHRNCVMGFSGSCPPRRIKIKFRMTRKIQSIFLVEESVSPSAVIPGLIWNLE